MSDDRIDICGACGKGRVRPLAKPGRHMRFRNVPDLEIPASVAIPTCDACAEEWIDLETAKRVDEALETAYQALLQTRAAEAVEDLGQHVFQRDLELLLNLSAGYLSKLRNKRVVPSAPLVATLELLRTDPANRLEEIRERMRQNPAPSPGPSRQSTKQAFIVAWQGFLPAWSWQISSEPRLDSFWREGKGLRAPHPTDPSFRRLLDETEEDTSLESIQPFMTRSDSSPGDRS